MKTKGKTGFSLIELMVVISIISLLSSLSFASISNSRIQAGDLKRIQDLQAINKMFELYYADNGTYPYFNNVSFDGGQYINSTMPEWDTVLGAAMRPYATRMPKPNGGAAYEYYHGMPNPLCWGYTFNRLTIKDGFYLKTYLQGVNSITATDGGNDPLAYEIRGGQTFLGETCVF